MINLSHFETFPELETERLKLRQLSISDAKEFQKLRSNPLVMQFMDSPMHVKLIDSEKFIQENIDMYANKKGLFWALTDKNTDQYLGDFSFWQIDHKNHRAEIGYTLNPNNWNKGVMTEAIEAIINFGFEQLNLHSIEANINPSNIASRQLLLKQNFTKEAYFKENYFFDGKYLDSEIYSLVNTAKNN